CARALHVALAQEQQGQDGERQRWSVVRKRGLGARESAVLQEDPLGRTTAFRNAAGIDRRPQWTVSFSDFAKFVLTSPASVETVVLPLRLRVRAFPRAVFGTTRVQDQASGAGLTVVLTRCPTTLAPQTSASGPTMYVCPLTTRLSVTRTVRGFP